jgi:hypothetical protein
VYAPYSRNKATSQLVLADGVSAKLAFRVVPLYLTDGAKWLVGFSHRSNAV